MSQVQETRERLGLSLNEFGRLVGYDPTYIGRVERGERRLTIYLADAIRESTGFQLQAELTERQQLRRYKAALLWLARGGNQIAKRALQ